jgi:hypothetical protein
LLGGSRMHGSTWWLTLGLGLVVVLLADVALAELGPIRLAAGRLILTLITLASTRAVVEQIATLGAIERLYAWMQRELVEIEAGTPPADEREFWTSLADRGQAQAGALAGLCPSVSVLEREPDRRTLALRASAGLDPSDHERLATPESIERCRSALGAAALTRRARWAQPLDDQKSLVIPLPASGSLSLVGIWLVHLPFDVELAPADLSALERIGRELAGAIEWRRDRAALRDSDARSGCDRLDAVAVGVQLLRAAPLDHPAGAVRTRPDPLSRSRGLG